MQIDHDPREMSHKAIKIAAVIAVVITIAAMIPIAFGIRWTVSQMPIPIIALLVGAMSGICAGFYIGRWDATRQLRTPGKDG